MNRTCFLIVCLFGYLVLVTVAFGQSGGGSAPLMASYETAANRLRTLPPNVASIERYGNVPVNFNTGQLNYSIPVHMIEVDNNNSIPIQLTYNNTGLKPDEVPTWVGNGWDLHVGGTIVQTINGLDDFDGTTGLQIQANRDALNAFVAGTMTATQRYQYCNNVVNNFTDSQFDVFSFNFPGKSGKFYFDKASDGSPKAVLYSQQPLRINLVNNQFIINDERGNVYTFTESIDGNETYSSAPFYTDSDPYRLSSKTWYLTKITTASGVEVIFSYRDDIAYQLGISNYSCSTSPDIGGYGTYSCGPQSSIMTVRQKIISQITWKGKKVVFETINRNDLYNTNGSNAQALARIKVYNESNEIVRQIGFEYDNRKHLQLQNLSFLDKVTGNKLQTYSFEYYGDAGNIPIPFLIGPSGTNSANNAIDHWGYYNGKSNTSKIPAADYTKFTPSPSQPSLATADRASDGTYSLIGMLKRIIYPTKGYTEITYEPNRIKYSSSTPIPTFMQNQDVLSGYSPLAQDSNSECGSPRNGTFSVPSDLVGVRIRWQLQGYSNPGSNVGSSFQLTNSSGQILVKDASASLKTGSTHIDLPAGTYSYQLNVGCQTPLFTSGTTQAPSLAPPMASFVADKPTSGDINLAVGGNRVVKIVDYDGDKGYNERIISYDQASLLNAPDYITTHQKGVANSSPSLPTCIVQGTAFVINERIIYGWDGFHITYRQVIESIGQGGTNGQRVYMFDDSYYVGQSFRQAPFPPAQNLPWRTANLLTESSYRKKPDGSFELVEKAGNAYTSATLTAKANGAKIERMLFCPNGTSTNPEVNFPFNSIKVPVFSDQFGVDTKTQEQWFSGNILGQSTKYEYNADWLVKQVSTINSKNQSEKILTYYANDYNNGAGGNITSLKAINAIGIPLKIVRTVNEQAVEGGQRSLMHRLILLNYIS